MWHPLWFGVHQVQSGTHWAPVGVTGCTLQRQAQQFQPVHQLAHFGTD
jgi:hypothetical protein